jgi:nucleotide-binding universal stress UspA family protein
VRLRNIGVGYDGSPESEAALALAGSLAVAAHAELHIRAVVDDRVRRLVCSALGGLVATEAVDVVVQEEERLRDRTAAATNAIDANVEAQVRRGNPSEVLLTLCNDVDLLVFGSRRWGAIARVVLGRTGEAVARDAGCPLLVVPRPAS